MSNLPSQQNLSTTSNLVLYSASWLVPLSQDPIAQGAVVIADDRIVAVGPLSDLQNQYPGVEHIPFSGILMPPLVNGHIHLELSHLGHVPRPGPDQKMTSWIEDLLKLRETEKELDLKKCMEEAIEDQYRSGSILLLDIGNRHDRFFDLGEKPCDIIPLLEIIGPTQVALDHSIATIVQLGPKIAATAHAPYSTAGKLIWHLKQASLKQGTLFSIHVAESKDEREFLQKGTGCFRDFLEKRNAWDGSFGFEEEGLSGTVAYLDQLGVLDSNTLCVHCVHLTEDEIKILAKRKAFVCLCPGSNRYLRVGKAPLDMMLKHNLLPAIGTDSLASNEKLDLWREMQLLQVEHPGVQPSTILKMATLGGAKALNRDKDYGTLEQNKRAKFLHVDDPRLQGINGGEELLSVLVGLGRPNQVSWIHNKQQ